jgi:GT2 family glycosyltransferase
MRYVANITVAIPTLDRPAALARCLEGLLQGSVLPGEVLIINQGQSSAVEQVIERFRSEPSPKIVHCPQPPRGLSAARNLAAREAHYEVIAFTDDDCVPAPDWLARIEQTLKSKPPVDAVGGNILPLDADSAGQYPVSIRSVQKEKKFHGRALPWQVGSGGNFAIKRNALLQIGGYDERLGAGSPGKAAEDTDLFYRLLEAGRTIHYVPEVVVYHERQDAARLLQSFWNYSYGIGAFIAKHVRKGDVYAAYILGVWLFWLVWRTGGSLLRRKSVYRSEAILSLQGCTHGLKYGFKFR